MVIRKSLIVLSLAVIAGLSGSVVALAANTFTDVPSNHVFYSDISWLADTGITKGCNPPANDQYCPEDPVTRGQMAAFLHRFANVPVETTIAIDQLGFFPIADESYGYVDYDYNAAGTLGRTSSGRLGASVPVPDGATVTGFSATVCDSLSTNDIVVELVRRPDPAVSGAYSETMAELVSSGDGCAVTMTTASIANAVVDTDNYSYAVVTGGSVGYATPGWIRRVTVTYEAPLVP